VYEQFAYAIQQKYPQLMVEGDNYPPPPVQYYLSQLLNVLKLSLIVLIVASQNPFEWINKATPSAYSWALENKVFSSFVSLVLSFPPV